MKRFAVMTSVLMIVLFSCSQPPAQPPATLADLEKVTAAKSAHEIAIFIFDNYGCKNCHTVASGGKFGYTETGQQLRNKSEGCSALLTTVSRIPYLPDADRTPEQQQNRAHRHEQG